ncbi:MAG: aminotransferase class I/II-fold pyridoxal phosphate-dependent enzyme [Candidatus Aminicenantes bacterium]|nr:aminotransferase class I/II-fold pyridoxal phosphate-dependent enzyme [Candidatus Aminicenantes bacterium]
MPDEIIPHSRPSISDSDIKAFVSVLKSGQLSQGPKVREFEKKFALLIGKKKAVAVSSGSAALHLALLAMDVKGSDEVIIPSFVCSAVLNAVNYTGATPVLVDIDPLNFNMSFESAKRAITKKTRAIIVPHMFGCPAEIDKLSELGIPLIEDCAQSLGANFKGKKAGSFGLLSVFSFYATKVIATAEGGMVLSDSEDLIFRIKDLREYDTKDDYVLRYNYKMTDIQAALGLNQILSLEKFIDRRREIATLYFQEFKNCNFSLPVWKEGRDHIYYRFVIKTRNSAAEYLEKFQQKKVICRRPVYIPLHVYLNLSGFPHTMEAWQKTISIPLYPSLQKKEIEKIIAIVREIFK